MKYYRVQASFGQLSIDVTVSAISPAKAIRKAQKLCVSAFQIQDGYSMFIKECY